jgi:hypothetical protein
MAKSAKRLFICLDNEGYEGSLERLKIYVALTDVKAERNGYLRIIDESGEDYLYLSQRFVAAELPVSTLDFKGSVCAPLRLRQTRQRPLRSPGPTDTYGPCCCNR